MMESRERKAAERVEQFSKLGEAEKLNNTEAGRKTQNNLLQGDAGYPNGQIFFVGYGLRCVHSVVAWAFGPTLAKLTEFGRKIGRECGSSLFLRRITAVPCSAHGIFFARLIRMAVALTGGAVHEGHCTRRFLRSVLPTCTVPLTTVVGGDGSFNLSLGA